GQDDLRRRVASNFGPVAYARAGSEAPPREKRKRTGERSMPLSIRDASARAIRFGALWGSASLIAIAAGSPALAQTAPAATAQAAPTQIPEQVLVTGSLIHGAAAVGVPVTSLSTQDFKQAGALTTSDLFKTIPAAQVNASQSRTDAGSQTERGQNVNLRVLSTKGPR